MARLVLLSLSLLFASSLAWELDVNVRTNKLLSNSWESYKLTVPVTAEADLLLSDQVLELSSVPSDPKKALRLTLAAITDLTPEIKYEDTHERFMLSGKKSFLKRNIQAVKQGKVSKNCVQLKLKNLKFGRKEWVYVCAAKENAAYFRAVMCHIMKAKSFGVLPKWGDYKQCSRVHVASPLPPTQDDTPAVAPPTSKAEQEAEEALKAKEEEEEEDDFEEEASSGSKVIDDASFESGSSGLSERSSDLTSTGSTKSLSSSMETSPSKETGVRVEDEEDEEEEEEEEDEEEEEEEEDEQEEDSSCTVEGIALDLIDESAPEAHAKCLRMAAKCPINPLISELTQDDHFKKQVAKHNGGVDAFCLSVQRHIQTLLREQRKKLAAAASLSAEVDPSAPEGPSKAHREFMKGIKSKIEERRQPEPEEPETEEP